jgi:FtsZ-binding cell division protein ZapB
MSIAQQVEIEDLKTRITRLESMKGASEDLTALVKEVERLKNQYRMLNARTSRGQKDE